VTKKKQVQAAVSQEILRVEVPELEAWFEFDPQKIAPPYGADGFMVRINTNATFNATNWLIWLKSQARGATGGEIAGIDLGMGHLVLELKPRVQSADVRSVAVGYLRKLVAAGKKLTPEQIAGFSFTPMSLREAMADWAYSTQGVVSGSNNLRDAED
jgi:hypothetical protein